MVRNIIIILVLVPLAISFFAPKRELYYLLEEKLQEMNIVISNEEIETNMFGVDIYNPVIYTSGIPIATVESIDATSILYTTNIEAVNAKIAEGLPQEVVLDVVDLSNMIITPLSISVDGVSSIGNIKGDIDLGDRIAHINVDAQKIPKSLERFFKKGEEGLYYESNF